MRFVALNKVAKIDRAVASEEECETLPYVGLEHIEKDTGRFAAEFEGKPESLRATKFRFTPRHVLYGKLRPYLNKAALPNFDGVCTTEILPILPLEGKLDRTYLWAFLLTPSFVEWASANVSGANLPRISPKLLEKHEIPLPPLPEQKRIAAILAKADRLRRLRRYARELSDTYLQSVFLEMFGDPVSNPMGWEKTRLGSLCQIIRGERLEMAPKGTISTSVQQKITLLKKAWARVFL
jgi:type I restriction enzyme S subunit